MRVAIGSLSIDLPDTWSDRTVHTFVAPRVIDPRQSPHLRLGSGFRENVAFSRERIRPGLGPQKFLSQQMAELKTRLTGFRMLNEEPCTYCGFEAYSVSYQFILRGQRVEVCQMRVAILTRPNEVMLFTGTSAASVFESKKQNFEKVLQSIEIPA